MSNVVRQTGNVGARLDLHVRHGASLEKHSLTLLQTPVGPGLNLTGYLVRAWCKGRGVNAAVTQDFTITRVNDVAGQIELDMPAATTELLPNPATSTSPPEVMDWWLEIEAPNQTVTPVFYGEYEVHGG